MTYNFSIYAKYNNNGLPWVELTIVGTPTSRSWFNIETGVKGVGVGEIISVGNGWYRLSTYSTVGVTSGSVYFTPRAGDNDAGAVAGDGTAHSYIWGAQFNQGATAQTYQQTGATANTANGFVATWYDQSGNARNATQATAGNQQYIVEAGVLNRVNGIPMPKYGAALSLATTAAFGTAAQRTVISANTCSLSPSAYQYVWQQGPVVSNAGNGFLVNTTTYADWTNGDMVAFGDGFDTGRAPRFVSSGRTTTDSLAIYSVSLGTSKSQIRANGTAQTSRVSSLGTFYAVAGVFTLSGTGSQGLVGSIGEVFYIDGEISDADLSIIERNQGQFFGIGVA